MPFLRLEVFDSAPGPGSGPGSAAVVTDQSAIDEDRLASWEQGYRAGWDDATASDQGERDRLSAELTRNLLALAFTWQEARSHILESIEPLLKEIISRLLPELARETLGPILLEQLMPLVSEACDQPAHILLNPAARDRVEALLNTATGLPLAIEEEPSLSESQAYLRLGPREVKVDLTRSCAEIMSAVQSFFTLSQEKSDG